MSIDEAERKQDVFHGSLSALSTYSSKWKECIEAENNLLNNAKKFTRGEKNLLKGLKVEYFRGIMMKEKNQSLGIKRKKIISAIIMCFLITKSRID